MQITSTIAPDLALEIPTSAARRSPKRFIADGISSLNLGCGILSIAFSFHGHLAFALVCLLVGGMLDGLDGAAARRWGGTRFGVYSDDIADGVNYGVAPGLALFFTLGGAEGVVLGVAFTLFTLARLVYFTLMKGKGDPEYFAGVPSTIGGVVVLTSLVLFPTFPALVGLMVGVAITLMTAFETPYRHLGRAAAKRKEALWLFLPMAGLMAFLGIRLGGALPAGIILTVSLVYALAPTARRMGAAVVGRRAARA